MPIEAGYNDGWVFSEMWEMIKVLDFGEVIDLTDRTGFDSRMSF